MIPASHFAGRALPAASSVKLAPGNCDAPIFRRQGKAYARCCAFGNPGPPAPSVSGLRARSRSRRGGFGDADLRLSTARPSSQPNCNFSNFSFLQVRAVDIFGPNEFPSQPAPNRASTTQKSRPNSYSGTNLQTPEPEEVDFSEADLSASHEGTPKEIASRISGFKTQLLQGNGAEEEVLVQEYKLTEEGDLVKVKLRVGGGSRRIRASLIRVVSQIGAQVAALQKEIKEFSIRQFVKDFWEKKPEQELQFNPTMYEPKAGVSALAQWTATDLTLQRTQMVRIARDTQYLVWAFTLFGSVRILEAIVAVFATNPPNFKKLLDAANALDPLTVASLAHAMRLPVVGMLDVDPTHINEVANLKAKFWTELHKFYERQWKVMATLGIARLLALIATNLPSSEWVTSKVKVLWDISMALPIF